MENKEGTEVEAKERGREREREREGEREREEGREREGEGESRKKRRLVNSDPAKALYFYPTLSVKLFHLVFSVSLTSSIS